MAAWWDHSRYRIAVAVLLLIAIGQSVEHVGRPIWKQPENRWELQTYATAFIHRDHNGDCFLSNRSEGSAGYAIYFRQARGWGGLGICARVSEVRRFAVRCDGEWLSEAAEQPWCAQMAKHLGNPIVLLGDQTIERRLIFGFPSFWIYFVVLAGAAYALRVCVRDFALAFHKAFKDRVSARIRALGRMRCPACDYDIRGLPLRRCPECGERWTRAEERDAAAIA